MNKQKKIMLLGGIHYLRPVIEAAQEQGYYVITADYLPDNIAHKYSDEYCNVNIVDKEAVLRAAQERKIDGMTVELTKINTTLKMLIGILGAIAVPILAVAVKLLFS